MEVVYSALESGGTVIVPGRRLALAMKDEHAARQWHTGKRVWETPRIQGFDDWVNEQLQELVYLGQLRIQGRSIRILKTIQQQALWLQVLGTSTKDIPAAPRLLATVMAAWKVIHESGSSLPSRTTGSTEDLAFTRWAEQYAALCDQRGVRDVPALWPVVLKAIEDGRLKVPSSVLWYGFLPDVEPRREALDKVLRTRGVVVDAYLPQGELSGDVLRCRETDQEWRAAGLWAAGQVDENPNAQVAIVVPDLDSSSDRVTRIILEACSPASILETPVRTQGLLDVSVSHPFSQEPVIAAALTILDLSAPLVDFSVLSEIVRSSWISGAQESANSRARLDLELRNTFPARCNEAALKALFAMAATRDRDYASMWKRSGEALFNLRNATTLKPSQWIELVTALLQEFGWPGLSDLASAPYQYYRKFLEVCSSMALADEFSDLMKWSEFLELFTSALDLPFLPRTSRAPIQILSPEVAVGMTFDALWISGATDEVFPPKSGWNPLVPAELRDRCSPWRRQGKAWSYAEALLKALHASAPLVMTSWAERRTGEERLARPSPLVSSISARTCEPLPPWTSRQWSISDDLLEDRPMDHPVPLDENSRSRGGFKIFEDQAACPFRRFAKQLLHVREVESPVEGLSPSELGSTVHSALDCFWREVKSHAVLCGMTHDARRECIHKAAVSACDKHGKKYPFRMSPTVKDVEIIRVESILNEWIETVEIPRTPFTVEKVEEATKTKIGGLEIDVRVDRVDRLEQGKGVLLLDYKTGAIDRAPWFEERLNSPQLPIYSRVVSDARGIAFGCLKKNSRGEMQIYGFAADQEWISWMSQMKLPRALQGMDWDSMVGFWDRALTKLAQEIVAGRADVDPKYPLVTCRFCSLPVLCRKWELDSAEQDDEENDDD